MSWLYRVLAVGVLIGLLTLGYRAWATHQQGIGEDRATARYNAAIDRQKAQAGQLLQAETDRANAATAKLIVLKTEREKQDVENQSTIDRLAAGLRTAAGPAGRLRDPNAVAGCGGRGGGAPGADPASADGGADDGANAAGLLSEDLTGLLLSQANAADDINIAYASCRLDAINLREVLK